MIRYFIEGEFGGDFEFIVEAENEQQACDAACDRVADSCKNITGLDSEDIEITNVEVVSATQKTRDDANALARRERVEHIVSQILLKDGPDGHSDGADVIADFMMAVLQGEGEMWFEQYEKQEKLL